MEGEFGRGDAEGGGEVAGAEFLGAEVGDDLEAVGVAEGLKEG